MHISLDYYRILTIPIKANKKQIERAYEDRIQQKPRREYSEFAVEARKSLLEEAYNFLYDDEKRAEYDGRFLTKLQQEPVNHIEETLPPEPKKSLTPHKILLSLDEAVSLESQHLSKAHNTSSAEIGQFPTSQKVTAKEVAHVYPTLEISPKLLVGALIILHELAEYEQVIRLGNNYLNDPDDTNHFEQEIISKQNTENNPSTENNVTSDEVDPRKDVISAMALSYLELGREKWRIQEYEMAACSAQMGFNLLQQEQLFYMLQEELKTDSYKLRPYRILDLLANNPANSPQRATGLELLQEMLEQREGIEGKGEDYSGLKFDKFLGFIQQVRNYLTTQEQIELFEAEAKRNSFVGTYLAMYALLAQGYGTKQPYLILKAQAMLKLLSEGQEEVHWEQAVCYLLLGQAEQAQMSIERSQEKATVELIKQYSQDSPDLLPGLCFYGEKWLLREVLSQFGDLENSQVTLDDYFNDRKVQSYLDRLSPVSAKSYDKSSVKVQEAVSESKGARFPNWVSWNKSAQKPAIKSDSVGGSRNSVKSNTQTISHNSTATAVATKAPINQPPNPRIVPNVNRKSVKTRRVVKSRKTTSGSLIKSSLFSLALILGLGSFGFVFTRSVLQLASNSAEESIIQETEKIAKVEEPETSLSQAKVQPKPTEKPKIFDKAIAKNVVEMWLNSKSIALGNQHNVNQLNKILAPSQIPKWSGIALQDKRNNIYRQYEHTVTIGKVNFTETNPNKATIEAQIKEKTHYYQSGKPNAFKSDSDNLLVRYQLIRKGKSWLIDKSEVLKSL